MELFVEADDQLVGLFTYGLFNDIFNGSEIAYKLTERDVEGSSHDQSVFLMLETKFHTHRKQDAIL
jgi:hypothetical protein